MPLSENDIEQLRDMIAENCFAGLTTPVLMLKDRPKNNDGEWRTLRDGIVKASGLQKDRESFRINFKTPTNVRIIFPDPAQEYAEVDVAPPSNPSAPAVAISSAMIVVDDDGPLDGPVVVDDDDGIVDLTGGEDNGYQPPADVLAAIADMGPEWQVSASASPTAVGGALGDSFPVGDSLEVIGVKGGEAAEFECLLCSDTHPRDEGINLPCCWKRVCKEMLQGFVLSKMNDQSLPPMCPMQPLKLCDKTLPQKFCTNLFEDDPTTQEKYEKISARCEMTRAGAIFCQAPDCEGCLWEDDLGNSDLSTSETHFVCPLDTKHQFCIKCKIPYHEKQTCDEYNTALKDGCDTDRQRTLTEALMKDMGYAQCPKCKAGIERKDGCNAIFCVCGASFCYLCGYLSPKNDAHKHFAEKGPCYGKLWEGTRVGKGEPPKVDTREHVNKALELLDAGKANKGGGKKRKR